MAALFGLLWLAPTSAAATHRGPTRLPLTFVQSNPVTTITVGNLTVQTIVDTGGGELTLSKEVLDQTGAIPLGDTKIGSDAFGRDVKQARFRVPVVVIGGRTLTNVMALEAQPFAPGEGPPVANSLGRQFLRNYFVVVDYTRAAITLWPPHARNRASKSCGPIRIPMERAEDDALVVGHFDTPQGPLRLAFDTGANYSMLTGSVATKMQLATTRRGPDSPMFYRTNLMTRGGQPLGGLDFVVLPLDLPEHFDGMLGQNFFASHVVCLDYGRREVRIR